MPERSLDPIRPRLLVSVRDADEAEIACAEGADLVDAKDPDRGALGALPADSVRAIVTRVGGRAATSAVADMASGVAALTDAGLRYVKVAIRHGHDADALARVAAAAPGRLIGVFFAEDGIGSTAVAALARAGFRGAMIDTRGKDGRGLGHWMTPDRIAAFVAESRAHGLLTGLAGSLRVEDVAGLSALGPDYLGFRGGLCHRCDRRERLDPARVAAAVQAMCTFGRREAA